MSRAKMSTTFVPPNVGGNTPMERFEEILRRVVTAPRSVVGARTVKPKPKGRKKR